MPYKELEHIIAEGESEMLEFKQTFSKAVIETLVAFSNTRGGSVLIGVSDDKTIVGVSITSETVQKWMNEIKQNTSPAIFPIIDILKFETKVVVKLQINEFPIKPIAYKDRYYARKQNSNHKLTIDEITALRLYSLSYSFDSYEVNSSFEQLDSTALAYFSHTVTHNKRFHLSTNIKADLIKLGILKKEKLTRAAELLFGLHHTNIHIGRFKTETVIIDDLMIRKPLILAVDEAMNFIKKNIRVGFEFGGETTKRVEKWQYPLPAIREFLLNAIVHRDYNNPTDLIIKIFDDSLEITNPGKLMGDLTVKKILSGNYISIHRNKLLTEAFYLTGDIEKYGTGFGRINNWLEDYPNLKFNIYDLNHFIQVKIETLSNDTLNDTLNDRQQKIMALIAQNNSITIAKMAAACNTSILTIKRDLKKMQEQNIIKRNGSKKSGYWEIVVK